MLPRCYKGTFLYEPCLTGLHSRPPHNGQPYLHVTVDALTASPLQFSLKVTMKLQLGTYSQGGMWLRYSCGSQRGSLNERDG
jgi:hypothetical protein